MPAEEMKVGAAVPRAAAMAAEAMAAAAAAVPFPACHDPRQAEGEIAAFAFRRLLAIFAQRGALRPGESCELAELSRRLGVAPKYRRYFAALVRKLVARGLVRLEGDRVEIIPPAAASGEPGAVDLAAVETAAADFSRGFAERHPAGRALLDLALRGLAHYEEILSGRIDVAEIFFAGAEMDAFAALFRGDPVADYFNRAVAAAVAATVRVGESARPAPVRVLEIGAGTGGTTAEILAALEPFPERAEVCFSDISRAFVRHARQRFAAAYPWLEYRTLDIEKDLAGQGFAAHSYDVVVAAQVLHDTRDIELTLAQVRRLLKPGGLLVLNEYTALKDCLFFSGALLHGYWLFEDAGRRLPDTCLLSLAQWHHALAASGFTLAGQVVLPTQDPAVECGQAVLVCCAPTALTLNTSPLAPLAPLAPEALLAPAAPLAPRRAPAAPRDGAASPESAALVGAGIEEDILAILGEDRAAAYAPWLPLMELGLDSIELVEIKLLVGRRFGVNLPPSFLFEHETQQKMAAALAARLPLAPAPATVQAAPPSPPSRTPPTPPPPLTAAVLPVPPRRPSPLLDDAIAVVGIACRFAGGATTPAAFWQLLARGESAFGTLPAGRWEWPAWVDLSGAHRGMDQGAFLPRIDEFAAPFFRVSRQEAEWMDPQQRLLLELSWEALEDAGCRPAGLAGRQIGVFVGACQGDYRDLLVASAQADPGSAGTDAMPALAAGAYLGPGCAPSMLANRLSYFYDLKGPSLTLDTACSSSLFALHEGIGALRRGDCEAALVGAVNLMCSPAVTLAYYRAGMLSPSGVCRTFDAAGDGYVRGEGGAMLLVKPLALALAQGDAIYGLVRGTAVNHGGQATTLTAPRPDAQADVVAAAWQAAGADPASAGYIETHGTATPLGDPIEISGLKEAFRRLSAASGGTPPEAPSCGLGSVKSNIGHTEGAAGLAGLLKVLLAIQHRQIPRTVNFHRLNPEIDLAGSPFYVALGHAAWPSPRDAAGRELPRRAGVSSFGFGGANAHVVVEEHHDPRPPAAAAPGGCLVPLSARTEAELRERARALLAFLERFEDGGEDAPLLARSARIARIEADLGGILARRFGVADGAPDLDWTELGWGAVEIQWFLAAVEESFGLRLTNRALIECPTLHALAERIFGERRQPHGGLDGETAPGTPDSAPRAEAACSLDEVACTLQIGREAMEERLALVVASPRELVAALRRWLAGEPGGEAHRGYARRPGRGGESPVASLDGAGLAGLAARWVSGAEVDWQRLWPRQQPRRAHLPAYPFTRERYWVTPAAPPAARRPLLRPAAGAAGAVLFTCRLTGAESFVADHVIGGARLLPAVVYLELARAAVEAAALPSAGEHGGTAGVALRSVAWLRPLRVGAETVVSLRLTPEGGAGQGFEIFTTLATGREVLHAQGSAGIERMAAPPRLNVAQVRARCGEAHVGAAACYRAFAAMGFAYGPAHRCIAELHVGGDEILARLALAAPLAASCGDYVLHPGLADSAVQATLGFALDAVAAAAGSPPVALPFEVERAEILRACTPAMWAHVRRGAAPDASGGRRFDIDLGDETGLLCAWFRGWVARPLPAGFPHLPPAAAVPAAAPAERAAPADLLLGEQLLVPAWEPIAAPRPSPPDQGPAAARPLAAGRLALVGGHQGASPALPAASAESAVRRVMPQARVLAVFPGDSVESMRHAIAAWGAIDQLVWIVPHRRPDAADGEALLAAQEEGVLFGFRLVKALVAEGYDARPLHWWVITTQSVGLPGAHPADAVSPAHAGVHGLVGSMAREYPDWQVRLVDLPPAQAAAPGVESPPWDELLALAADPRGQVRAYRDGRWHRRRLVPFRAAAPAAEVYRAGAVYVVIGGAGGVGAAWSEALLRRLPVRLAWIGRRPLDAGIAAQMARLAAIGPEPLYIAADAADRAQLTAARQQIERELGRIDGVVHAAMDLRDKSLAGMAEADFRAGISAKIDICVRLAQVFPVESLDFVLFFSSVASFLCWPGQANYAAGCTFEDAFARHLAAGRACRALVMNWGYWQGVGAAAGDRYAAAMTRQGLGGIAIEGAMKALDALLAEPAAQLAYLSVLDAKVLAGLVAEPPPASTGAAFDAAIFDAAVLGGETREAAIARLLAHVQVRVAAILGVDAGTLDSRARPFGTALLGEFGVDSLSANSLRNALRNELAVDLAVHRIIADPVQVMVGALYEQLLLKQVGQQSDEAWGETGEVRETFVF